jgi:predicted RNase H-like nuclease (RuvC/YqgF family)
MTLRATYRDELETLRQHVERLEESLRELVRRREERHRANGTGPYAPSALQRGMYRLGQRVGRALRRSPEARHESAIAQARARIEELESRLRAASEP